MSRRLLKEISANETALAAKLKAASPYKKALKNLTFGLASRSIMSNPLTLINLAFIDLAAAYAGTI